MEGLPLFLGKRTFRRSNNLHVTGKSNKFPHIEQLDYEAKRKELNSQKNFRGVRVSVKLLHHRVKTVFQVFMFQMSAKNMEKCYFVKPTTIIILM